MSKFQDFNPTVSYPCGKKSLFDYLKKKTYIKDLDGNILYEGRGMFQKVLEQAVAEGVELPKADLRNRKFETLNITNAKLAGASFENSKICSTSYMGISFDSDLSNSDLTGVSFKCAKVEYDTKFAGSDIEKADVDGLDFHNMRGLAEIKNFDKAYNVKRKDLEAWKQAQPAVEAERRKQKKDNEIMNPKPSAFDIVQFKAVKSR